MNGFVYGLRQHINVQGTNKFYCISNSIHFSSNELDFNMLFWNDGSLMASNTFFNKSNCFIPKSLVISLHRYFAPQVTLRASIVDLLTIQNIFGEEFLLKHKKVNTCMGLMSDVFKN